MGFLYGDSTPSPLESNFLEFLRDALDFSVVLLRADENIRALLKRKRADARAADEETERLGAFGGLMTAAIQDAPKGDAESETSRCAARLTASTADFVNVSVETVRAALANRIAHADAEEAAERQASFKALEALLLPHAPPGSSVLVRFARGPAGTYEASAKGEAAFGLAWLLELAIPDGHAFTSPLPIERLAQTLEISAPSTAGWLKKELKVRPQRLERFVLAEVVDDGKSMSLKLRADIGSDQGFDFDVDPGAGVVSAARASGAKEGSPDGSFELSGEDASKLVALAEKVRAAIAEIKGGRLVEATFDGGDFRGFPVFEGVVDRLIALLAPTVKEIARHSLTQTELVIRRLLSNERREEIFVTKSALREKYSHLPAAQRSLFDALALEAQAAAVSGSQAPKPVAADPPATRSEVPRSEPPPPRASSAPPSWTDVGKPPPLPPDRPSSPSGRRLPPRSTP